MPRQKKKDNQTVATVENLEIKIEQAMKREDVMDYINSLEPNKG